MDQESEKSKGIAYLLLVVGPMFGFCGLQRLYMGQIGTGLLYVFTFGLLGVGQLVDLFTFGRVVENHNLTRKLREYRRPPPIPTAIPKGEYGPELSRQLSNLGRMRGKKRLRTILRFVQCKGGMVNPIEIVAASSLDLEEAKKSLDELCSQGAAELRITEGGEMVYVFPGFLNEEQKRKARSVLAV